MSYAAAARAHLPCAQGCPCKWLCRCLSAWLVLCASRRVQADLVFPTFSLSPRSAPAVAVRHCLLALPGVEKGDIKRVLSHPQALAQTDSYTRRMPGVVREAVDDTGGWGHSRRGQGCLAHYVAVRKRDPAPVWHDTFMTHRRRQQAACKNLPWPLFAAPCLPAGAACATPACACALPSCSGRGQADHGE